MPQLQADHYSTLSQILHFLLHASPTCSSRQSPSPSSSLEAAEFELPTYAMECIHALPTEVAAAIPPMFDPQAPVTSLAMPRAEIAFRTGTAIFSDLSKDTVDSGVKFIYTGMVMGILSLSPRNLYNDEPPNVDGNGVYSKQAPLGAMSRELRCLSDIELADEALSAFVFLEELLVTDLYKPGQYVKIFLVHAVWS
ncbi:hypothetical protein ARMGADRAFT_1075108 [Armillaria gallica]|uniref:Uncharacterized protein n=1 Tax=Armillaria gallica TaxID=47427 RepID=A0A2H3DSR2_ARMGA|nr:hypothetical protein ARMGADRAFT_1075108 [Armillaria gallica]